MPKYAFVQNGKVSKVIVAKPHLIASGKFGDPLKFVETAFGLRKNVAGKGFSYDSTADAFIPPSPFPSWTLDSQTYTWKSPKPYPSDDTKGYRWDEAALEWVALA